MRWSRAIISLLIVLSAAFPASAAPTQEDVFKSIQQNVGGKHSEEGGSSGMAVLLCAAAGLMTVMLVGARINRRQSTPRVLDHPGKLLREVMRMVPLKPNELKQLKELAEESQQDPSAEGVQHPLTLLLCPSVLGRIIKNHPAKIDRVVMTQIVRKMGAASR